MVEQGQNWASVSVGIWNGSRSTSDGTLLYRKLLSEAMIHGIRGGTVWRVIEGGNRGGVFRSIESEVASNELPLWIEFIDQAPTVQSWLPTAQRLLAGCGVIVLNPEVQQGLSFTGGETPTSGLNSEGGDLAVNQQEHTESGRTNVGENQAGLSTVKGLQITIYTLERAKVNGKPLYQAAAEYLRHRDILWVATMRGLYGYGESRAIRQAGWFNKVDTPVMMVAADKEEKLAPHVAGLVELVGSSGFVVTSPVKWMEP